MVLKNYRNTIALILFILALFLSGIYLAYYYGQSKADTKVIEKEIKVVETKIDTIRESVKGDEKIVYKYIDKIKEIERKKVVYDTLACKDIVAKKDSIIFYKDSIIGRKDSIIYKERVIVQLKDTIIEKVKEIQCKKSLGFKAGFIGGIAVGVGGTLLIQK